MEINWPMSKICFGPKIRAVRWLSDALFQEAHPCLVAVDLHVGPVFFSHLVISWLFSQVFFRLVSHRSVFCAKFCVLATPSFVQANAKIFFISLRYERWGGDSQFVIFQQIIHFWVCILRPMKCHCKWMKIWRFKK